MALLDGKQIKSNSVADSKLATLYTKADGTRAFTGDQSMGGFKLTNLAAPTSDNDAARKIDVDVAKNNFDFKDSVLVATTANITLSGEQTIDGVLTSSSRVLVKDQSSGEENGIYVTGSGAWVRSTDADASSEVTAGMYVFVDQGTANANTAYVLTTNDTIVLDTTALVFAKYSGLGQITAGAGLSKSGDTIDVGDAGKGVQVNANDLEIDASEIASTGLEVGTSSHLLRLAAQGNGIAGGAGSVLSVLAENDSVAVGVGGVKSAVPKNANKAITASVTTADFQTTGATISSTPAADSYVTVMVNGIRQEVGDGVKTKDCYFSADGGTTAKAISDIAASDTIYWVGSVAGFELAATDEIDIDYVLA